MGEHKHLRRLGQLYVRSPVFFLTACLFRRRSLLANDIAASILRKEWQESRDRHGWMVNRYVIMPDHVHFIAWPSANPVSLSKWMQQWKQWTAKQLTRSLGVAPPVWQREFVDHLCRSEPKIGEKWEYVRQNPVRAGLVNGPEDWPWSGVIHPM